MSDPGWFELFLKESAEISLLQYIYGLANDSFFALDDVAYECITAQVKEHRKLPERIVRQQFLPLALSRELSIRRIVVVDTGDEEAALVRLKQALIDAEFPASIVETLEFVTFFGDLLPAAITRQPVETLTFGPVATARDTRLYAIVSTPRSGSTYLSELLRSIGLGTPLEHVRPWLINFLAARPIGLFNPIRFTQRLIAFGSNGGIFGTKLIGHLLFSFLKTLTVAELSYLHELSAGATVVYLNRQEKLDQAISSLRAQKTGVWHSIYQTHKSANESPRIAYDFDEISSTLGYVITEEERLARLLVERSKLVLVDYDEISVAPAPSCQRVAASLGVTATAEPTAKVTKLADETSMTMASRFRSEARERGLAVTSVLETYPLLEASRAAALNAQQERATESDRIRNGHARMRGGSYQDRHYHLIDYDCFEVPGLPEMWRGPRPKSFDQGQYVLFLGAAQTYGAFVPNPFPTQVGARLGIDILNLGKGGASPLFFSESQKMRELVAGARAVVVQAMAARMVPTSRFDSYGHMNLMYMRDDATRTFVDSATVWEAVRTSEPEEVLHRLVAEARDTWTQSMCSIASCAQGPTVLLWFSERQPSYKIQFDSNFNMFHFFPQLVDEATVGAVKPAYSNYVEVVTPRGGAHEVTRSMFSGVVLPVVFGGERMEEQSLQTVNHYYPTQGMHNLVADRLTPVVEKLLIG